MSHVLELSRLLRVDDFPLLIEHSEGGDALLNGHAVLLGILKVVVNSPDPHMYEYIVLVQQLVVGCLVKVDIEYLAVAAPVATEVKENALVLTPRPASERR